MNYIKRIKLDVKDARALEEARAENKRNEATIAYVAMMADVDIPIEEGGAEDAQPEV